jgi:hypothetical protein
MGQSSVEDQRRSIRKRVLWSGVIVSDEKARIIPCAIRSISGSGAQIRVDSDDVIPAVFFLVDRKSLIGYRARTVWRRANFAGVEFEQSVPIDGPLPRELRFLRTVLAGAGFMKARGQRSQASSLVTLGVADLEQARAARRLTK